MDSPFDVLLIIIVFKRLAKADMVSFKINLAQKFLMGRRTGFCDLGQFFMSGLKNYCELDQLIDLKIYYSSVFTKLSTNNNCFMSHLFVF